MKRLALAFALALAVSLTLLTGAAGAHHRHHGFRGGHVTVFIGPPFIVPHRHFFIHHGFFAPGFTFIVVDPAPRPVWVPGFWRWDGFDRVWVPGHWFVPGHRLLLRNPCD